MLPLRGKRKHPRCIGVQSMHRGRDVSPARLCTVSAVGIGNPGRDGWYTHQETERTAGVSCRWTRAFCGNLRSFLAPPKPDLQRAGLARAGTGNDIRALKRRFKAITPF